MSNMATLIKVELAEVVKCKGVMQRRKGHDKLTPWKCDMVRKTAAYEPCRRTT